MKRNITILFAILGFSFAFGQNKFDKILNSKKLAFSYKTVKDKDKQDYYQQYYWLVKAEELKAYPHLQNIKPIILYQFVKEINPEFSTKKLDKDDKELRENSEHALNQFFSKKDLQNQNLMYNLESYINPNGTDYFTIVNPERVAELIPKQLYTFTSVNKSSKKEKTYYLWVDDNKYRIMNVIPEESDAKFYASLRTYLPNYKISKFVPEIKKGDKKDKKDGDFYYITPFQEGEENIVYKTKDFEEFTLIRYKKSGKPWTDVEQNKK